MSAPIRHKREVAATTNLRGSGGQSISRCRTAVRNSETLYRVTASAPHHRPPRIRCGENSSLVIIRSGALRSHHYATSTAASPCLSAALVSALTDSGPATWRLSPGSHVTRSVGIPILPLSGAPARAARNGPRSSASITASNCDQRRCPRPVAVFAKTPPTSDPRTGFPTQRASSANICPQAAGNAWLTSNRRVPRMRRKALHKRPL